MKLNNKAQSLPLNTIVIAILVIIVLLVIVVFFVSKMGENTETLNQQSASTCSVSNPAIATFGYTDANQNSVFDENHENYGCRVGWERISAIPIKEENGNKLVCCGTKGN